MSRKRAKARSSGSSTLSAWGTSFSGSYPSEMKQKPREWGAVSSSRPTTHKVKPVSGKARKSPTGWRAPTPFRATVCRLIPGPAFHYYARGSDDELQHKGERGYNPASGEADIFFGTAGAGRFPRTSQNLENRAVTECMNKLADGEANVAESVATLDQTFVMIARAASEMRNVWTSLRNKQKAKAEAWDRVRQMYYSYIRNEVRQGKHRKRLRQREFMKSYGQPPRRPPVNPASKRAGGAWLELMYGWKPLVQDIEFATKTFREGLPRQRLTATRNVQEEHDLPSGGPRAYNYEATGYVTSGCKVRIDTELKHPNTALLNSLGLINPFQLGWELLPFSFVLDWLLPIGNAIKALSTPFGLSLLGISITRYTKMGVNVKWCQYSGYKRGSKIECSMHSLATERKVSFFWPFPRTYSKSPFTNLSRAVTALALLQQLR